MMEISALFTQVTDFNHFQCIHILNLTHRIIRERANPCDSQLSQLWTILHIQTTVFLLQPFFFLFRKALIPNYHTLQLLQPQNAHSLHILETLIPHSEFPEISKSPQIQFLQTPIITTIITHFNHTNSCIRTVPIILTSDYYPFLCHCRQFFSCFPLSLLRQVFFLSFLPLFLFFPLFLIDRFLQLFSIPKRPRILNPHIFNTLECVWNHAPFQ